MRPVGTTTITNDEFVNIITKIRDAIWELQSKVDRLEVRVSQLSIETDFNEESD